MESTQSVNAFILPQGEAIFEIEQNNQLIKNEHPENKPDSRKGAILKQKYLLKCMFITRVQPNMENHCQGSFSLSANV